jgi:hypothetical protein
MKHLRDEFKTRAAMLKTLSKHYATDDDDNKTFKDGSIVELGFKSSYNEKTEISTIISDYRVDVLWNLEEPPIYKEEVTPKTTDHRFGGW